MVKMRRIRQRTLFLSIFFTVLVVSGCFFVSATNDTDIAIQVPINHIQESTYKIQSLIDEANPFDTIIIPKGIYNQTLVISQPLTLTSTNPLETIIDAHTPINQAAITIRSDQVYISNLTIRNSGPGLYTTGIRVLANKTTIDSCIIHHTSVGIAVWSSHNTISNCNFHRCNDEGIVLLNTSYLTCTYNTIVNCSFFYNCDAIELQQSSHNIISNCTMKYNTHSGIDAIKNNNNHNIITACTISENRVHGIYLSHSSYNIITSCTLDNNSDGDLIQHPQTTNFVIRRIPSNVESVLKEDVFSSFPRSNIYLLIQIIQQIRLNLISIFQIS